MTIPTNTPVTVAALTNSGGHYEVQTGAPHGIPLGGGTVTIDGVRDTTTGALITGINGTHAVTYVDPTHFLTTVAFASVTFFGGGVWLQGLELPSSQLTSFDGALATMVTDKTGDTILGSASITVTATPGMIASTPTSSVLTNNPVAFIIDLSSHITLGDNDDVQLLPPRTRSIMLSCLETFDDYGNEAISNYGFSGASNLSGQFTIDNNGNFNIFDGFTTGAKGVFGVSDSKLIANTPTSSIRNFWIPLTRVHDKATLLAATLLFFPSPYTTLAGAANVPTILPTLQIFRINPALDITLTSLSANGAAVFPTPKSLAAYGTTPAVAATGNVVPSFVLLGENQIAVQAGTKLTDSANNVFQVTIGGNYELGDVIPVTSVAPSSGTFFGGNTNHIAGDVLTWANPPAGMQPTVVVATGGLAGGLSPGYAQQLVFTPDQSKAVIDQSTYVYVALITDDNVCYSNSVTNCATCYAGLRLDFGNITSMSPQ